MNHIVAEDSIRFPATSFACWVLIILNRNSRWFVCTPLNRKFRFPIELVLSVRFFRYSSLPLPFTPPPPPSSQNRNFSLLLHRGIAVTFQLSSVVRAKKWFISRTKGRVFRFPSSTFFSSSKTIFNPWYSSVEFLAVFDRSIYRFYICNYEI